MDPRALSRWSVPVGPDGSGCVQFDPRSGSVYLADGWSVPPRSRSLRRLDAITGDELALARTRSRPVTAMLLHAGDLIVGTPGRLLSLNPLTLDVLATLELGADVIPSSLGRDGDLVAVAVAYRPTLYVVDLTSGAVRRRRGRSGQTVQQFGAEMRVYNAQVPDWRRLTADGSMLDRQSSPAPVVHVAGDRTIWGIPTGTSLGEGRPSWGFSPAAEVVRLEPVGARWPLPERATGLDVLDEAGELWVTSGFTGRRVLRLDQRTGAILGDFRLASGKTAAVSAHLGALLVDVPAAGGHRAHWCPIGA